MSHSPHQSVPRTGSSLLECLVAISLLLVGMAALAQMLVLAQHQRDRFDRRQLLLHELSAWAEQAATLDYADLREEKLLSLPLNEKFTQRLPQAVRTVHIAATPAGGPAGTQINLSLALPQEAELKLACLRYAVSPVRSTATPPEAQP